PRLHTATRRELTKDNKVPGLTWLLRSVVASWSRVNPIGSMPDDELGGMVAQAIQEKEGAREWLTENAYVPDDRDQPLGELEHAFRLSREACHVGQKIKDAVRDGALPKQRPQQLLDEAVAEGVISGEEHDLVRRADEAPVPRGDGAPQSEEDVSRDDYSPETA
ncbi:MAG: hypothetical protein BRD27_00455, partial [Bacteroidetes bacterium QH_10_64_19]